MIIKYINMRIKLIPDSDVGPKYYIDGATS